MVGNPFASISMPTTSPPPLSPFDEKSEVARRPSTSRGSKIASFFSTSPKSKAEAQTATAALLAAAHVQQGALQQQISSPTLSLPVISLSTARADSAVDDEPPKTLFQPDSPAAVRKKAKQDAQFGPLAHSSHLYTSQHRGGALPEPIVDEPPYFFLFTTYISYLILIVFGHVRDFFGKRFRKAHYVHLQERNGYAALNNDFDNFYIRRLKTRLNDCFSRPTTGVPGRYITLVDRISHDYNCTFQMTGTTTETLNMSSYNYLGFAQSDGPCADAAEKATRECGTSLASARGDVGTSDLHLEVEDLIADFVGKPAACLFSMGFGTNASVFSALVGKGCLIISDELNHSSIRFGARCSGAMIDSFKHNDVNDLERLLREVLTQGQPRTHRPWKRILVIVEGLYSMEGTMCNLPGLIALKRRYKFHLFVDEAHSIGALGPRGRGVCDYFGVDTSEVDILMGTLTKSFGANGGYIAGDRAVIDKLRVTNAGSLFSESMTPPVLAQIASSLQVISGHIEKGQGEERLRRLAFNSRYLRLGLKRLGFIIYGHDDSPIIPLLLYNPAKMPAFSHEMLQRKISVVVVGYPATPLISSRARFCVSAAHTKDDLDRMLTACDIVGDILQLKYSSGVAGGARPSADGASLPTEKVRQRPEKDHAEEVVQPPRWPISDVLACGVHDVKLPLR